MGTCIITSHCHIIATAIAHITTTTLCCHHTTITTQQQTREGIRRENDEGRGWAVELSP